MLGLQHQRRLGKLSRVSDRLIAPRAQPNNDQLPLLGHSAGVNWGDQPRYYKWKLLGPFPDTQGHIKQVLSGDGGEAMSLLY